MRRTQRLMLLAAVGLAAIGLAACTGDEAALFAPTPAFVAPQVERDAEGRCFGRDVTPAVIETVIEQELATPAVLAADGSVTRPATFRTVTRQQITRERQEVLFETICPEALSVDFVASLQRALKARGRYDGPISGAMDARTAAAIQRFQAEDGHDSPLLDIRTARALGLIALSAEELAAET